MTPKDQTKYYAYYRLNLKFHNVQIHVHDCILNNLSSCKDERELLQKKNDISYNMFCFLPIQQLFRKLKNKPHIQADVKKINTIIL